MWREWMFLLSTEQRMMRNYMIMLFAVLGFAILGAQAVVNASAWLVPAAQQTLASTSRTETAHETRVYTLTRSVLDDPTHTGSIAGLPRKDADCRK